MRIIKRDGKLYARITLRDVLERHDVDDKSLLADVRRMCERNDRLVEMVRTLKHHVCRVHSSDPCDAVCDAWDSGLNCCSYELRMRELGIEDTYE